MMTPEEKAVAALLLIDSQYESLGFDKWSELCQVVYEYRRQACDDQRFWNIYAAAASRLVAADRDS